MRARNLAVTFVLAVSAPQALAWGFAPAGSGFASTGWVTADSAYAAAARTLNLQYPSGTQDEPGFSPEQFSTTVESSLEARLEARLKREMERKEAESGESVSAS